MSSGRDQFLTPNAPYVLRRQQWSTTGWFRTNRHSTAPRMNQQLPLQATAGRQQHPKHRPVNTSSSYLVMCEVYFISINICFNICFFFHESEIIFFLRLCYYVHWRWIWPQHFEHTSSLRWQHAESQHPKLDVVCHLSWKSSLCEPYIEQTAI